ncbi:MAG: hypothetical protein V3U97_00335 [bacterium]
MDKDEMKETAIMAFIFGCGFWVSAEALDFVFGMISGLLDMM